MVIQLLLKKSTRDSRNGSDTLKILIVSNSITGGGAEEASYRLFSSLNELRDVTAYFCAVNSADSRDINSSLSDKIIFLKRKHKSGVGATLFSLLRFSTLVKKISPSHIIANCELPELLVALSSSFGAKVICVEHTSKPWAGRWLLGVFIRFILFVRGVQWVTVVSSQENIWWTNRKSNYIPNIVEISINEIEKSDEIHELVFIGRLIPDKQPEMVIRAGVDYGVRTSIYGTGQQLEELRKKYNGEEELIDFYGFMQNPFSYVNSGALVVVPSEYEGDGLVVVESILAGVPILLRDNVDLRRFELPDIHYFHTQEELNAKIKYIKCYGLSEFFVSDEIKNKLMNSRSAAKVRVNWIEFLTDRSSRVVLPK